MRKMFVVALAVLCLASILQAQATMPPAMICEIHINKVKPGMTQQYEQGRAKHMAWHKSQNDSWEWVTWEITTGENTGNYLVGSCGHQWKDFDAREKFNVADSANANSTMGNMLAAETMSYYVLRPDLTPMPPSDNPPAYLNVIHFFLKPEAAGDFTEAVKKVNDGIKKTNYQSGRSAWYSLVSGGNGPEVVLVQERNNMAEMAGPGKSLDAMMQEAYGADGAAIMASLRKAYWHSYSELLHFRSDLSYMPPAPKPSAPKP
jgi:hypothetical protein